MSVCLILGPCLLGGHWQRERYAIKLIHYKTHLGAELGRSAPKAHRSQRRALLTPATPKPLAQHGCWSCSKGENKETVLLEVWLREPPTFTVLNCLEWQSDVGAQSCKIIYESYLGGEAMSFKGLVMFLFGFSRNKSKVRTLRSESLWKKGKDKKNPVNFAVILLQEHIKNTSFSPRKSIWFSRREISISIFYSKRSTACLWKDQCPKWKKFWGKRNTLTATIFHIKIHTFSYHEVAVDCLFHYRNFYDVFYLLRMTVDLKVARSLWKSTVKSPKHLFYLPETGSGF